LPGAHQATLRTGGGYWVSSRTDRSVSFGQDERIVAINSPAGAAESVQRGGTIGRVVVEVGTGHPVGIVHGAGAQTDWKLVEPAGVEIRLGVLHSDRPEAVNW
jgi:hypothetical protein